MIRGEMLGHAIGRMLWPALWGGSPEYRMVMADTRVRAEAAKIDAGDTAGC